MPGTAGTILAAALAAGVIAALPACAGAADPPPPGSDAGAGVAGQRFPDVVAATAQRSGDALRFTVTISSPYDTPQRYADAFRVRDTDGTVFGVRELAHDHAAEQPFTRSLDAVDVPPGTDVVVVEGRDLVHGWGGRTVTVAVPR